MQTITLYLPPGIEAKQLRDDLEEIIADYAGKERIYFPFHLSYAVGQAKVYEIPAKGTIITITNDIGKFCDENIHVPGGALWYNAKILLMGFNEETLEFKCMKDNFEYLNNKYKWE